VLEKINETRDWLIEKVQEQSNKGLDEDPSFTISQVETKIKAVSKLYKKVVSKKKPKEKKKEEPKEDEQNKEDE
jgi:hypothetical protein